MGWAAHSCHYANDNMTQVVRHLRPFLLFGPRAAHSAPKHCKMARFSFHLVGKARYPRRIVQGAADYMGSVDASHRQRGHEANGVGHSIMFEGNIRVAGGLALHILIVSADEQTAALCAEGAKSLGHACHIARTEDEARGLFAQHSQINFVIHNATTSAQHGLDLLSSLHDRTQNGRNFIAILLASQPDLDLALAAMRQGVSDLLTLPLSPDAITSAIDRASARIMSKQDATAQPDLTDSISLIQSSLSALMNKLGVQEPVLAKMELDVEATLSEENSIDPAMLKAIIKARRNRHKFFEGDLFSDPSWDILLELTAAHLNGRQESVTSLAIAASVPASTAIRKIRELADRNLIHRWTDPNDARRIFVALTEDAAKRMMAMLASAQKASII